LKRSAFFILVFLCSATSAFASYPDTVIHVNGDILTGDLKKLVYGVLSYKMDGMGTISMDEIDVRTIISKKEYEIKLKGGDIYFGSIDSAGVGRKINIVSGKERKLVNISDVVEIYRIKNNVWNRTSGNISVGGNYSKGSDIATISNSGGLTYRKKKLYVNLNWNSNSTYQADSLSSSNAELDLSWQRLFKNKWSSEITAGISQNTELGQQRQLDLSITGIKDISYNSWNRFYTGMGLVVTNETPTDDTPAQTNLTGLFQLVWKVYKYTEPKVGVDANINFSPYITNSGRYTVSMNVNPSISIFGDNLQVGIQFYYNYDSRPVTETAANFDYGITFQIGYSFH
jgi:hypothetical protein